MEEALLTMHSTNEMLLKQNEEQAVELEIIKYGDVN